MPEETRVSSQFNVSGICEVNMGDDSAFMRDLDVFLEAKQEWKDLLQAFKDHNLITDNYNTLFFEPRNEEERIRGYRY
jgi:hypothetical protein